MSNLLRVTGKSTTLEGYESKTCGFLFDNISYIHITVKYSRYKEDEAEDLLIHFIDGTDIQFYEFNLDVLKHQIKNWLYQKGTKGWIWINPKNIIQILPKEKKNECRVILHPVQNRYKKRIFNTNVTFNYVDNLFELCPVSFDFEKSSEEIMLFLENYANRRQHKR